MNIEILSVFLFFLAIGILVFKNRKHLEIRNGIIIKRWKKGREKIDDLLKKHTKIFNYLGLASSIICIALSIYVVYWLIESALSLKQIFGIALPSVSGVTYPKPIISIPFWYWLFGIFLVIFPHETMHAIMARLSKIKIKDYGIFLFLVLPLGAFVDINEKKIKKLKLIEKLRIYSAGSFGNFLTGILFLLLLWLVITSFDFLTTSIGVKYSYLINGSPAMQVNLSGYIKRIDNVTIKDVFDLQDVLSSKKPGDQIEIETSTGTFQLKLIENPDIQNRSFIGIGDVTTAYKFRLTNSMLPEPIFQLFSIFYQFFSWTILLSFGVGLANLLPIKPLDGGKIWESIFLKINKKHGEKIANLLSLITLFLLVFSIFGGFFIESFF